MTGPRRKKRMIASTEHVSRMPPPIRAPSDSTMPLASSPSQLRSTAMPSDSSTPLASNSSQLPSTPVPSNSSTALPSSSSGPSQSQGLGSTPDSPQVPESPMSVASAVGSIRVKISAQGDREFDDSKCVRAIGEIIEQNYHGCWPTWKLVPLLNKKMMFGEFGKKFMWSEDETSKIWDVFRKRAAIVLKNRLSRANNPVRKQPEWIGDENWKKLCEIWDKPEHQKKSAIAKANRASNCGGEGYPLHRGGSRSHLMHFQDMTTANGGVPPSLSKYFLSLRSRMDETGEIKFVDERSKKTYYKWEKKRTEHPIPQDLQGTLVEFQEWAEDQGGPTKDGSVYGLGGVASFVTMPMTSNPPFTSALEKATEDATQKLLAAQAEENKEIKEENKKIKEQLELLKEMVMSLSSQAQATQTPFHHQAVQGSYLMSRPGFMPSSGFISAGFVPHPGFINSTTGQVHNITTTSSQLITEKRKKQISLNDVEGECTSNEVGEEGDGDDEENDEEEEDEEE